MYDMNRTIKGAMAYPGGRGVLGGYKPPEN